MSSGISLPEPPPSSLSHPLEPDTARLRSWLRGLAVGAGMDSCRVALFLAAVEEAVSHALRVATPPYEVKCWATSTALFVDIATLAWFDPSTTLMSKEWSRPPGEDGREYGWRHKITADLWLLTRLVDVAIIHGPDHSRMRIVQHLVAVAPPGQPQPRLDGPTMYATVDETGLAVVYGGGVGRFHLEA